MNVRLVALPLLVASAALIPSRSAAQLPGNLIVTVTAPQAGATVGGTVPFTANVTIIGGLTVQNVEFRVNGVPIGVDTTAPYSIEWDTRAAGNGSRRLSAAARDVLGLTYASADVTVTVANDLTPPTVAMSAPAAGVIVSGDVAVAATASDNVAVAGVRFTLDGNPLGAEDTSSPYGVTWNTASASDGAHTLAAIARDTAGNMTTSTAVTVTVDSVPPSVAISAPAANATLGGAITIAANASDSSGIAGVQFTIDGAPVGAEDTSAPYGAVWDSAAASDGAHSIAAIARDNAGRTTVSAAVPVRVDNTPPAVAISAPAGGTTVSGTITISADASDSGGIAAVQFLVDGVNVGAEDTSAPYSVSWNTTAAADGSHAIAAIARDGFGRTTTSGTVAVTVANVTTTSARVEDNSTSIVYSGSWALGNTTKAWSGGTASLATGGPSATGTQTRATLTFTGTAVKWIGFRGPQTGIARVHLDGTLVATIDTYASTETVGAVVYEVSGLAAATHTLAVEATGTKNPASSDIFIVVDAFDLMTTNQTDRTPPAVAMTSPAPATTVSGVLTVQADASDDVGVTVVQFWRDGSILIGDDTTAPYAVDWNTAGVSDGSHSVHATARDAAGNTTTSAAVTVTVANGAPPPASGTFTRFENTNLSTSYSEGTGAPGRPALWWHGSRSRGWSNQTSSFNRSLGGRATFAFSGTQARWIGFRAPWAGIAKVYVDGTFIQEIDLYSTTEQAQAVIFSTAVLSPGDHTLTVESTGRKRGGDACHIDPATGQPFSPAPADCSTDWAVVVDAFDVAPARPVPVNGTRVEETDSSMQFTASWAAAPTAGKAWSGGSAMASAAPGESVTFKFAGTSVSWIGLTGGGTAQVFLDGALQATIATASPLENHNVIYRATNLAPANHELRIVVGTGTIYVDAFDVGSRFEDGYASVAYNGTWTRENQDRAWSGETPNTGGGTASLSSVAGATAVFTFTGSEVRWIGYRGPLGGIAEVSLDGGPVTRVDLYAPAEQVRAAVFEQTGLADAQHALTIRVTGERNASAAHSLVIVDAFDVKLSATLPEVGRFQETHATITYAPEWEQPNPMPYRSGGGIKGSNQVGARATLTFTGTGARWVGRRFTDTGVARVYLDGALVATVDTRSSLQEEFQAEIFNVTGLPSATHTLTIEIVGRNGEAAGAIVAPVWVDAFDVYR